VEGATVWRGNGVEGAKCGGGGALRRIPMGVEEDNTQTKNRCERIA
jgi:hypothetical protein